MPNPYKQKKLHHCKWTGNIIEYPLHVQVTHTYYRQNLYAVLYIQWMSATFVCRWKAASRYWKTSHQQAQKGFSMLSGTVCLNSTSTDGLVKAACSVISSLLSFSFRYTTRHLNDDTTSKQIRALLQWAIVRVSLGLPLLETKDGSVSK